ncbi:MAG: N-acetylmuramoyl-L-alanine amidase [Crocinitomicaceae bacterium]|nr:N-acetylmuramoyl-L-alanine amidase [Crocinitomicaceae bacterium]
MTKVCSKSLFFNHSLTGKALLIIILMFSGFLESSFAQKPFKIVIDAGHGGKDPGRPNKSGIKEKDIVLNIALDLGKKLKNSGNEVLYTRDKDVFLTLRQRAKIANEADADLFISIHCNAFHDSSVHGSETFVYGLHVSNANLNIAKKENDITFLDEHYQETQESFNPSSTESVIGLTLMQEEYLDQSILLASFVQDNFRKDLNRKNRGVKQSGFWVLHNTYMPSILIEAGFMTNPNEGAYLNSKKGQTEISNSIYDAIIKYKKAINYSDDFDVKSNNQNPITYKVQIAAGKRWLELKSYNFKGLKDLSRIKQGTIYKYFYSSSKSLTEIKKKKKYARDNGFPNAYIVGFENGKLFEVD